MNIFEEQHSFILLTDVPIDTFNALKCSLESLRVSSQQEVYRAYYNEIFELEDAKEIIRMSFLQSDSNIWVIMGARIYNHYAQNCLLKILEEPPLNVSFAMIASNLSAILPTVRSRLRIIDERVGKPIEPFPIDLEKIKFNDIYNFLKEISKHHWNKEEVKEKIASLLLEVAKKNIPLRANDLDCFNKAIALAEHFEKAEYIFVPLLLRILRNVRNNSIKV